MPDRVGIAGGNGGTRSGESGPWGLEVQTLSCDERGLEVRLIQGSRGSSVNVAGRLGIGSAGSVNDCRKTWARHLRMTNNQSFKRKAMAREWHVSCMEVGMLGNDRMRRGVFDLEN